MAATLHATMGYQREVCMTDHVCRRLMLFLDGTWNEDDEARPATNIVYLRELLFWGLNTRLRKGLKEDVEAYQRLPESFRKKGISGLVFDGYEYIVYYERGVGTGAYLDAIKGGLTGDGLDQNIRQAYRFLTQWYRPGDEIFVFGFSRGAFTARSLCGFLQAVGLLRCEHCTTENEKKAWDYYRTPPGDRLSGEWAKFQAPVNGTGDALVHDSRFMRVRALGVFDTVGALGVPAQLLRRANQLKYAFHDTDINSLVDIRLHAMAIDEPRHAFAPSIWSKPKFKLTDDSESPTEQVWFAGAHSDVGGGYVNWAQREDGLSYIPLAWMIQRLNALVVGTRSIADAVPDFAPAVTPNPNAPIPFYTDRLLDGQGSISAKLQHFATLEQHKPWAKLYVVYPQNHRIINQLPLPGAPSKEASGRVPFGDPINEMIHVSALARFGQPVKTDMDRLMNAITGPQPYRPFNLENIIPYLAASYIRLPGVATPWRDIVAPILSWKESRLVDWDGRTLNPGNADDVKRAFDLLPTPEKLGITKRPAEMEFILDPRLPAAAPMAAPAKPAAKSAKPKAG